MSNRSSSIESDLADEIERVPMLSTHSHFAGAAPYANVDQLMAALAMSKHMSGRWRPGVSSGTEDVPLTKRSDEDTHQHVFRVRMLVQTFQEVFGYRGERLTREGLAEILPKVNAVRGADEAEAVARALGLANIAIQVVDRLDLDRCTDRLRTTRRLADIRPWQEAAASGTALDGYLSAFADAMREWRHSEPIVALKIPHAYSRTLSFSDPSELRARQLYERGPEKLGPADHFVVEDYLVRHALRLCAELGLPVQIHTGFGWRSGEPLRLENANVMHLVPLFEAPDFRGVRFLIFHGSWPYTAEMAYLAAAYENVYLDFNCLVYLSRDLSERTLSEWLDIVPLHKIMTGTDSPMLEVWMAAARETRKVLTRVLARKVLDGLYSEEMALDAARAILNLNAQEALDISL